MVDPTVEELTVMVVRVVVGLELDIYSPQICQAQVNLVIYMPRHKHQFKDWGVVKKSKKSQVSVGKSSILGGGPHISKKSRVSEGTKD